MIKTNSRKAVLVDFNVTTRLENPSAKLWTNTGTFAYRAPEMVNDESYNTKVDVWSAGLIMFYLQYQKVPTEHEHESEIMKRIRSFNLDTLLQSQEPEL